ncbi:hemerythrin domain-containing protein [Meridianimarinicoccus roseus]|uniref:hemerythrin domain-containing protein n=1 Tax=Meridianimarinicoccus roseus TaxID=2072018 RepID=UPI001EE66398|nr:hemerythrin domain-containing protein [Meridianimarinicoccus roseus]
MADDDDELKLETRVGLPDALRVLLEELPRAGWEAHPGFHGLARFWMQRHMLFRQIMDALTEEAELRLDAQVSADRLGARVNRLGGMLMSTLHEHHSIEDTVYFPKMQVMEPRLLRGFTMLDKDHHALDEWLNRFADASAGVVNTPSRDTTWVFHSELERLGPLLERHLRDEEDLVVPVILRTGLQ